MEGFLGVLTPKEINRARVEARSPARYSGFDVGRLGEICKTGKENTWDHEFVLASALPPDKDESNSRYSSEFFVFAHHREVELTEILREQQQFRVTRFKSATLDYIRASLASTEPVPPCNTSEPTKTVTVAGQNLKTLGCSDPVVENLRAYVRGMRKIAEAVAARSPPRHGSFEPSGDSRSWLV